MSSTQDIALQKTLTGLSTKFAAKQAAYFEELNRMTAEIVATEKQITSMGLQREFSYLCPGTTRFVQDDEGGEPIDWKVLEWRRGEPDGKLRLYYCEYAWEDVEDFDGHTTVDVLTFATPLAEAKAQIRLQMHRHLTGFIEALSKELDKETFFID